MLTGKKACVSQLHIFLTYHWLIYGQIDRNMNRSMVFLSINLLISVFREGCNTTWCKDTGECPGWAHTQMYYVLLLH